MTDLSLTVSRTINAPLEKVFNAWLDPEMIIGACRQDVLLFANYVIKTSKEITQDTQYLQSQSSATGRNEQILTDNPFIIQLKRLSHQFLNSSIIGQNYQNCYLA